MQYNYFIKKISFSLYQLTYFLDIIELNTKLKDLGVNRQDCSEMSKRVSGDLSSDPWWQEGNDLSQFYLKSI